MVIMFRIFIFGMFLAGAFGGGYYFGSSPSDNDKGQAVECVQSDGTGSEIQDPNETSIGQGGTLVISSWPYGASIFLNDEDTGKVTPYSFSDLIEGTYSIRLESDNTYKWYLQVDIKDGETSRQKAMLVEVNYVDREIGSTPFSIVSTIPTYGDLYDFENTELIDGEYPIVLKFDDAIFPGSIETGFRVIDLFDDTNVFSRAELTDETTVTLFVDEANLKSDHTYEVHVLPTLENKAGDILAVELGYTFGPLSDDSLYKRSENQNDVDNSEFLRRSERKANNDVRIEHLDILQKALSKYYADVGEYPSLSGEGDVFELFGVLVPNYLTEMTIDPLKPAGSTQTGYTYQSDGTTYSLTVRLEDVENANSYTDYSVTPDAEYVDTNNNDGLLNSSEDTSQTDTQETLLDSGGTPDGSTGVLSANVSARDAARKADISTLSTAFEMYYSDVGSYPISQGNQSVSTIEGISGYLPAIPQDPSDDRVGYLYESDGSSFVLSVELEETGEIYSMNSMN